VSKTDDKQRIVRLAPLRDALAALDAVAKPVKPRAIELGDAVGCVLASDVHAAKMPAKPVALRDGYAVRAEELADAGGYAPVALGKIPPLVETGDEMPPGADAVAPAETIVIKGEAAEALQAVTAGEGVLPAGAEVDSGTPLRNAGERLRVLDLVVLAAAEVARVQVRKPRVRIAAAREDLRLMPALRMIARDCATQGGEPLLTNGIELEDALRGDDVDAVIIVGGTGSGKRDRSVMALRSAGKVAAHGIGLTPGETAAIGDVDGKPILMVPGRLDAALAVWLVLGRHLLGRLAAGRHDAAAMTLELTRKVTSTVGLAEFVPVRRDGNKAEPLATKHLPLSALTRADGWLLVPPDSEGFAAGSAVRVNLWP
jgi:molybdopterin biosynthesis enzyme